MSGVDQLRALVSEKFTADVLNGVLKKRSGADEVTVNSITFADGGTKKGDSYLSILTRFTVDFTAKDKSGKSAKHSLHVISKAIPKNVARKKTFRSSVFFNNELVFYDQVWPELNEFQNSKNVKHPFNEIPDFFAGASDGENDFIAMEDLSYSGFGQAHRSAGLDMDTVKLIMKSFAKFHAIGLAYKDQHPDKFEKMISKFEETYFREKYRNWYKDFAEQCKDIVRHAVKKELNDEYLKKINSLFAGDFFKKLCDCCESRGPLSVITHGDAWIPNFLMKYDESRSRAVQTVMIDFQLARCAPVALDIMFFLYACTKGDFLEKHFTEVIKFYHENVISFLKQLGSSEKLFTYDALMAELKANVAFSVGMSMEAIIVGLLEDDEVTDIDQLQGEEAVPLTSIWVVKPFESQEKRRRVSDFAKHAIDNFL